MNNASGDKTLAGKPIGVAMLGCGVVGGGVAKLLAMRASELATRLGGPVELLHVVVKDVSRQRSGLPSGLNIHSDANAAIDDPQVQIVIELIGGTTLARQHIERALQQNKSVVTANKSLLAQAGPELFALARANGQVIGFEASCAGGIPIIDALTRGLSANRIRTLVGIINGTCNFILTKMSRENLTYADALRGAQDVGFAEADPALDVSGRDSAQKLAILSGLAFSLRVSEASIHRIGIDTLDARDITFARELGYTVKLLGIASRQAGGQVSLCVEPTLVKQRDMLADVSNGFNAVSVWGDAIGHAMFFGRGAGEMPTASAVVSDLISVASGSAQLHFATATCWADLCSDAKVLPYEETTGRAYLRLTATDRPGVLARVTEILGRRKISLGAVLQHESGDATNVPVVITTHHARRGDLIAAIKEIDALDVVTPPTVCLPIFDSPDEFSPDAGG